MRLTIRDSAISLLPELAVMHEGSRTLLLADLHLGKAAAFREAGVPLPDGTDQETLDALTQLLRRTHAEHLVILGDVFHARITARETLQNALTTWRRHHAQLALTVIPGNHDRRITWHEWLPDARILAEGAALHGFTLHHHPPEPPPDAPVLCGHLHPGLALGSPGTKTVRVPCFHLKGSVLTLPAFGKFTGMAIVRPGPDERCFVPLRDAVVPVPGRTR